MNDITTEVLRFILDILFTSKFALFMWKETSPALLILIMDVLKPKFIDHVNSHYDTIDTWDEDRSYYGLKFLVDDFIKQNGLLKSELINLLALGFKLDVRKENRTYLYGSFILDRYKSKFTWYQFFDFHIIINSEVLLLRDDSSSLTTGLFHIIYIMMMYVIFIFRCLFIC